MTNQSDLAHLVWSGDFKARIYDLLKERGCNSLTDYLLKHPAVPIIDISDKKDYLGFDLLRPIAAIQVLRLFAEECTNNDQIRFFYADILVRKLNENKAYWCTDKDHSWPLIQTYSEWRTLPIQFEGNDRMTDAVWNTLNKIVPNDGTWLPESPQDIYIVEAFNKAWPVRSCPIQ